MTRMSELALGARIPAPLLKKVLDAENDAQVASIGIEWATNQVQELIDNQIRGIHFYTLNMATATLEIFQNLHS